MGESSRESRIKDRQRPAIRCAGTADEQKTTPAENADADLFPDNAPIMRGYHYRPPKMRVRDKLREIIKILKK